ncbi:BREX system P-loop protein BrxC [Cerasibacillus terrae]|uniref:BREX system P-loop protein BrxC n=1 Tax=Cerasibacillus terrae TaxID=2498845 RepID=A0A5C8NSU5_9BACI|nr:BREX system P-loop protein BrxC [Cerasibacillus terrae]TXL64464.1 BREX system P-loop protein BrxC [Cerasibacillus terrae]
MIIKDMFHKDIDRDIRGVIKADQTNEDDVYQELEEYVVTRELHKHFSKFYQNYLKGTDGKTDKVGVWISGFFGSGKSHFLKILSYLLKNEKVKDKYPVDFFEDKILDPIVYANMKRTADVPTETILFNIDSKNQMGNKSNEDAILRVLLKEFNNHRGYYGHNPAVAELEKYLDEQGFLEAYKKEFEKIANEPWESRRNVFKFDGHFIKPALLQSTNMTEESVDNLLNHGIHNVDISIEGFAKEVKEYIDSKGPDFHLVFLIDEIGQYIGDRRDLMLNLQTVTENLGAFCQGQAWVMVTSQESIDTVVRVKGDDFSRIQGRFDTRLSLSSVSVDEVIQKRILDKKEYVGERLKASYPDKSAILKNLISFRDCTADLRGFEDAKEFADVYPFIPYQFMLLQKVFEQIRKHSASEKHISEGERSMLSAYREAGMRYMEENEGTLIPFHAFYDTIQEFLQPVVSRVIENAGRNPALADDRFNNDLLKVLFMIKYVKEIPANIDNIATLMVSHVDEDKLQLKEKINLSLRKLINQTLIQKNGEEYIFLTDDEQDVNREIKSLSVEEELVKRELAQYIFQDLYDVKKYSYSKMYDFPFNQKMDEKNYGNQTSSIGIHILSPLSSRYHQSEQELMMLTSGSNEVVVRLGGDETFIEEIEEALKIEEYRRSRNITQLPENIQNILNNKQVEMKDRRRRGRNLLEQALKEATFFINGNQVDIKGSTVKEKINEAFKMLIENIYYHLSYINEFTHQEGDLEAYLTANEEQITLDGTALESPNEKAKEEIDQFLRLQEEFNKQVRVKTLYDRFGHAPYGWRELDIAKIIAELLKEQHIRIRYNAEYLEPAENAKTLMTVFTKAIEADRGVIIVRKKVDESLIRSVRRIVRDLFDNRDLAEDEDGLIKDIRTLIDATEAEITAYKSRYEGRKYPGMSILDKGLEYFSQFDRGIDNVTFFKRMEELEDALGDWLEDVQYVKDFFNSNKKDIFDNGLATLEKYEDIKAYVQTDKVEEAMDQLTSIIYDPIPYGKIKDIPELIHVFEEEVEHVLQTKKGDTKEKVQIDFDEASLQANQYGVSKETKARVHSFYKQLLADIDVYKDIYKVDAAITQSNNYKLRAIKDMNNEIRDWQRKKELEQKERKDAKIVESTEVKPVIQRESVKLSDLISATTLKTEEDVDRYVNTLSNKLKQMIKANKEIEFIK